MNREVVLNNGITMPPIGYGVFRMTDLKECENAVVQAVKAGQNLDLMVQSEPLTMLMVSMSDHMVSESRTCKAC